MVSSETELPYNYYSLPFCKPAEGVRKSINSVNPGTILMGSRIENSPYNFSMLVSVHCCVLHALPAPSARLHHRSSHEYTFSPRDTWCHKMQVLQLDHACLHIFAPRIIRRVSPACRLKRRPRWHANRRDSMGLSLRGSYWLAISSLFALPQMPMTGVCSNDQQYCKTTAEVPSSSAPLSSMAQHTVLDFLGLSGAHQQSWTM